MLCFQLLQAQDTIVKRNGNKLIVKLVEVNPDNVRYKRLDYQEGPVFTLSKQEIKLLIYPNGIHESFENYVPPVVKEAILSPPAIDLSIQPSGSKYYYKERRISEPDMLAIVSKQNDKKINLMIKKVEEKKFIQMTTMILSLPIFITGLYLYAANTPRRSKRGSTTPTTSAEMRVNGEYLMLAGVACELVSISFKLNRTKHAHMVVDAYNAYIIH